MSAAIAEGDVSQCSVKPNAQGCEKPVFPTGTGIKDSPLLGSMEGVGRLTVAATPILRRTMLETIINEMFKGNYSFAILVVGVIQCILMIIYGERKKKKK